MHISGNKIKLLSGFIIISLVFVWLRLKTLNHLLMWDEAWNILSLRAFLASAKGDPFYWGYFFHPPLYMNFAKMLAPFKAGFDIRLESLSLLFSYATFAVMYLLSNRIGGWVYAWLSGLFLSLMPASIGYDTWIKRDGLASALGYLAIFLLLKRKFLWCAIALSFSLLSKENALFFMLSATLVFFILNEKEWLKKITVIYAVIFLLTSWWYIYFSTLSGTVFNLYFNSASEWAHRPLYYFKRLLPDLGMGSLFFFIIGICYFSYLIFREKQYKWLLPVIIAACVYIPASFFIRAKTPWLCLSARPALAMIAGGGAMLLLKKAEKSKFLLSAFILFFILSIFIGLSFSYPEYHMNANPNGWPGANSSRELALYLNERMRDDDTLMITEFAYWKMPVCAVFLYYWKGRPIEVIKGREKAENVIKEIINNKISWLVIADSPDPQFNFHPLVKEMANSALGKGAIVGWSYVWKADSLWSGDIENKPAN